MSRSCLVPMKRATTPSIIFSTSMCFVSVSQNLVRSAALFGVTLLRHIHRYSLLPHCIRSRQVTQSHLGRSRHFERTSYKSQFCDDEIPGRCFVFCELPAL